MKVIYTGRHVEVSDSLRQSAQDGLDKMQAYLDDIIDVHVIFSVEKHRHTAEITLKTSDGDFIASAESTDMYQSLSKPWTSLRCRPTGMPGSARRATRASSRSAGGPRPRAETAVGSRKSPGSRLGFFRSGGRVDIFSIETHIPEACRKDAHEEVKPWPPTPTRTA